MVLSLTSEEGVGAFEKFALRYDRKYARRLNEMTYRHLVRQTSIQSAAYIFTDYERMGPGFRALMRAVWDHMESLGPKVRLLNNPHKQLDRYGFLKKLRELGWNDYDVHWANDIPESVRFPVFVRGERDHTGPKSELIDDWDSLRRTLTQLTIAGFDLSQMIVVEFCDVSEQDGTYKKYGAFRIGDRVIGQHVFTATHWMAKVDTMVRTDETRDRSNEYFLTNPHADQLMPIFEAAGIQYGRLDYGVKNGFIQSWEINDCPIFTRHSGETFSQLRKDVVYMEAFDELAFGLDANERLPIDFGDLNVLELLKECCA